MNIQTFNHLADWDHPNEVVSLKTKTNGHAKNDITGVGSFTTEVGDRLLIVFDAGDVTSGYKLSSDMSSNNTIPSVATMQCHVSAHWFQLGDDTNNVKMAYTMGSEFHSTALWIDRATPANSRIAISVPSSNPIEFAGINSLTTVTNAGTDAALGSQTFDMLFRGSTFRGPVRILRWAAGETVPSAAEIAIMLEWMWYRWALFEYHILYPPLIDY